MYNINIIHTPQYMVQILREKGVFNILRSNLLHLEGAFGSFRLFKVDLAMSVCPSVCLEPMITLEGSNRFNSNLECGNTFFNRSSSSNMSYVGPLLLSPSPQIVYI